MKISGGRKEAGIVIGNVYDKYSSSNPIVKHIMRGFTETLTDFILKCEPDTIHEIGCGEGYWVMHWIEHGFQARGSDFSEAVIQLSKENAKNKGISPSSFCVRSIYELDEKLDSADLVVCCEVLEHLDNPEAGLHALQNAVQKNLIISVPREPLWCLLNLARGKYITSLGNTPGHVQHWSHKAFINLVSKYFDVVEVRTPLPWTMLLCKKLRIN